MAESLADRRHNHHPHIPKKVMAALAAVSLGTGLAASEFMNRGDSAPATTPVERSVPASDVPADLTGTPLPPGSVTETVGVFETVGADPLISDPPLTPPSVYDNRRTG